MELVKTIKTKYNSLSIDNRKLIVLLGISVFAAGAYIAIRGLRVWWYARKFLGESEIEGNKGFVNDRFEELMTIYGGFVDGDEWCMEFVKMIYLKKIRSPWLRSKLETMLSKSTQTTLRNILNDDSDSFEIIKNVNEAPRGAIVIWTNVENTAKGHAGIVQRQINENEFETIEGNVDNLVVEKTHTFDWNATKGMKLSAIIKIKGL